MQDMERAKECKEGRVIQKEQPALTARRRRRAKLRKERFEEAVAFPPPPRIVHQAPPPTPTPTPNNRDPHPPAMNQATLDREALKEESRKRDIAFGKPQTKVEACSEKLVGRLRMVCYQQAIDGASNTVVRSLGMKTRPPDVDKDLEGYYEPILIEGRAYSWAPDIRRVTHRYDESRYMGVLRPDGSLDQNAPDPLQHAESQSPGGTQTALGATIDRTSQPQVEVGQDPAEYSREDYLEYLERTQELQDRFGPESLEGLPELELDLLPEGEGGAWGGSSDEGGEEEEEGDEERREEVGGALPTNPEAPIPYPDRDPRPTLTPALTLTLALAPIGILA